MFQLQNEFSDSAKEPVQNSVIHKYTLIFRSKLDSFCKNPGLA